LTIFERATELENSGIFSTLTVIVAQNLQISGSSFETLVQFKRHSFLFCGKNILRIGLHDLGLQTFLYFNLLFLSQCVFDHVSPLTFFQTY